MIMYAMQFWKKITKSSGQATATGIILVRKLCQTKLEQIRI